MGKPEIDHPGNRVSLEITQNYYCLLEGGWKVGEPRIFWRGVLYIFLQCAFLI